LVSWSWAMWALLGCPCPSCRLRDPCRMSRWSSLRHPIRSLVSALRPGFRRLADLAARGAVRRRLRGDLPSQRTITTAARRPVPRCESPHPGHCPPAASTPRLCSGEFQGATVSNLATNADARPGGRPCSPLSPFWEPRVDSRVRCMAAAACRYQSALQPKNDHCALLTTQSAPVAGNIMGNVFIQIQAG